MLSVKRLLINGYMRICRLLCGVDKNKVIMNSFSGRSYSDNPRAVSEALHAAAPQVKQVWFFLDGKEKEQQLPGYISWIDCKKRSQEYKALATAAVVVSNNALPIIPKSKKQLFIQTWHGDKAFKKVLHDSPGSAEDRVVAEQLPGYCDYAVAGSEYGKMQYRSAFRYPGEVLMCGTPRNDRLIKQDVQEKQIIRRKLNWPEDVKLLLYAPTLRWEQMKAKEKQEIRGLDLSKTLDLLEKRDGCKWQCLLRAHPTMVGICGAGEDPRILDGSGYEDMADLLLISDMLITDYSSCAGDFALTGRPVVLFQADRQEYLEKDRTFYFDIEDSPYFVAENQTELETILMEMTEEKAKENCQKILAFYGDCETGHAAQTVAQIIKDWIER